MTTPSNAPKQKRDSLKAVRADIGALVKRLEAADNATHQSVAALETALRALAAQGRQDDPNEDAVYIRQQQLDAHITALKTRLTHMIRETQKAVNTDLTTAMNDPRLGTLAHAIDTANARVEKAEAEQSQNLSTLKNYVAALAREVDQTLESERATREMDLVATQEKQIKLSKDIAGCLTKLNTQEQALSLATNRLTAVETDTATAIELIGDKITRFAQQAADAREENSRVIKGKISDIALETQKNFDAYTDGLNRNIEALQTAHETAKHDFNRDLDLLRTRLETLEYGLTPNQVQPSTDRHNVIAPLHDAFTPESTTENTSREDTHDITQDVETETTSYNSLDKKPTSYEVETDSDVPVATLADPVISGENPENPYSSSQLSTPSNGLQTNTIDPVQPHMASPYAAQNQVQPHQDPHYNMATQSEFVADPYGQLNDPQTASYGPVETAQTQHSPNLSASGDIYDTPAYDDMPYANPAYAETGSALDIDRPGGPVEMSGGANRSGLFTPSKLRAAMLGVAVLGLGYTGYNMFLGGNSELDTQKSNVFVEAEPSDLVNKTETSAQPNKKSVNSTAPIGTYTDTIQQNAAKADGTPSAIDAAVESGDPAAQYQLGLVKLQNGETNDALKLLRASANKGQAAAQYRLAKLYEIGNGVKQDLETARELIDKSARSGNRIAMHDLANFYANGIGGVEQDLSVAAQWFEKAAERGVVDSQYNIGYLYEFGFGVPKNEVEAYVWYGIASKQGDSEAAKRIAVLDDTLSEVEVDSAKSRITGFKPVKINKTANGIFKNAAWQSSGEGDNNAPQIAQVQSLLNELGYSSGSADGQVGAKTRNAIIAFEKANGFPETGRINSALVQQLELAAGA